MLNLVVRIETTRL